MALMPAARWRPLPESKTAAGIRPTQLIYHSAVGSNSLYDYFAQASVVVESHFWVGLDGRIEQYVDTTHQADANYLANPRAISVETADNGDPEHFPWTAKQLDSLVEIAVWVHDTHQVPLRKCPAWDAPGLGYHILFPAEWTNVPGKVCPGKARIAQFPGVLQRAVVASTEGDPMTVADAVWAKRFYEYYDENASGKRDPRTTADILFSTHQRANQAEQIAYYSAEMSFALGTGDSVSAKLWLDLIRKLRNPHWPVITPPAVTTP